MQCGVSGGMAGAVWRWRWSYGGCSAEELRSLIIEPTRKGEAGVGQQVNLRCERLGTDVIVIRGHGHFFV